MIHAPKTSLYHQICKDKAFYLILILSFIAVICSFPREILSVITTKDSRIPEYTYNDDLNDGGQRAKEEAIFFDGWNISRHGLTLNGGQSGTLIYEFPKSLEQLVFLRLWFYKWEGAKNRLALAKGQDKDFQPISINHDYKGEVIDLTEKLLDHNSFRIKLEASCEANREETPLVIVDKFQILTKNPWATLPAIPFILFTFSLPLLTYYLSVNIGISNAKSFCLALGIGLFIFVLKYSYYPKLIYYFYFFLITWEFEFHPDPFYFWFLRTFEYGSALFFILVIGASMVWLRGTSKVNKHDYPGEVEITLNKKKICFHALAILSAGFTYGLSLEIIDSPKQDLLFLTQYPSQINSLFFAGLFLFLWLMSVKLISYYQETSAARSLELSAPTFYFAYSLTLLFLSPVLDIPSEYPIFLVILVTSLMISFQARYSFLTEGQHLIQNPAAFQNKGVKLCLAGCILSYFIIFVSLKFRLYDYVKLGLRDLTVFDQPLWNIAHTGSFQSSVMGKNFFAEHSHFLLMLLIPFYRIIPSPKILLFLQCLFLALGALPVYLLANEILKNQKASLLLAACYLLYPSLNYLNMDMIIFGFHPDSFLPTIILFSFYFAFRDKKGLYFSCMIATFLIKENTPMVYILLGCYLFFFLKKKSLGIITVMFSLLWFKFMIETIIPSILQVKAYSIGFYQSLGSNAFEIISNLLYNPLPILEKLWRDDVGLYILYLLIPVGFLPLLIPEIMLMIVPIIVLNLLPEYISIRVDSWHVATIIPFIFIASIIALKRIDKFYPPMTKSILIFVLSTSLLSQYYLGVAPFSKPFWNYNYVLSKREGPTYQYSQYLPSSREKMVKEIRKYIPDNESLSASFYLGSHFSHREEIYWFPNGAERVNYILLDKEYHTGPPEIRQAKRDFIIARYKGKGFQRVYAREGVYLFRKRPDISQNK